MVKKVECFQISRRVMVLHFPFCAYCGEDLAAKNWKNTRSTTESFEFMSDTGDVLEVTAREVTKTFTENSGALFQCP